MGKMLTTDEAAARLGVTADRVRMLCRQRRIPGAKLIGRTWMLPDRFAVTPGTRGPKGKR